MPRNSFLVMELKNRLQEVLWMKNLTHKELALLTGYERGDITRIVNGQKDIMLSKAKKIARALGCTVDYLWPD